MIGLEAVRRGTGTFLQEFSAGFLLDLMTLGPLRHWGGRGVSGSIAQHLSWAALRAPVATWVTS